MMSTSEEQAKEIEELRSRLVRLERRLGARNRNLATAAAAIAAGSVAFWGAKAFSDPTTPAACAHSELYCFQPNTPALAAQVNSNFETVAKGVDTKFDKAGGTVSGNVTVTGSTTSGTLTSNGLLTGDRAMISNGIIQRGGTALTSTSDLGLYSQVPGNYIRIVTNGAPINFYTDSGIGSTVTFGINPDGSLASNYNETATWALLPPSFCVIVPRYEAACPGGWTMRELKWDTEDSNNADFGKDGPNAIASDDGNTSSLRMKFCCRGSGFP